MKSHDLTEICKHNFDCTNKELTGRQIAVKTKLIWKTSQSETHKSYASNPLTLVKKTKCLTSNIKSEQLQKLWQTSPHLEFKLGMCTFSKNSWGKRMLK